MSNKINHVIKHEEIPQNNIEICGLSHKRIKPDVNILNPVFQSIQGRLYAGTTPLLTFGGDKSAWARLVNPYSSGVNLYLAYFLFTNNSENPYSADLMIDADPPGKIFTSPHVGNLNSGSGNKPVGKIQYNPSTDGNPNGGTRIAPRRIPANNTLGF
jgi:hypothetical protein